MSISYAFLRTRLYAIIKKVQGYIRYRNVTLNDIGDLCYHKAEFDDSDFAKKYHEKVALKFERSEKEQADS